MQHLLEYGDSLGEAFLIKRREGCEGAAAIRAAGGRVLAQDETSSVVWGVPGAVVRGGHADEILSLDSVAARLCSLVSAP